MKVSKDFSKTLGRIYIGVGVLECLDMRYDKEILNNLAVIVDDMCPAGLILKIFAQFSHF